MIKITQLEAGESATTQLRVEGRIVGKAVDELERACRAAFASGRPLLLDLGGVSFLDAEGIRAVHALVDRGAVAVGCSGLVDELLRVSTSRAKDTEPDDGDARLLEALRRGDGAAFEDLVRLYAGRMLAVARRMLRAEEDARDAVQEAFISAFKALDTFNGAAKLSTWLHRIVVNAALMRLRRQRRKPEDSIDELLPRFDETGHWAEEPATLNTPAELAERRETRELVRECIDRLPKSYRTVLLLRDIEELDTDETAAALGMTASAVKTRLHRARQALRTLLEERLALGSPSMPAARLAG